MDIQKKRDGGRLILSIQGRLDAATSPCLESSIKEDFEDIQELELDFSALEYISSAGLRVVLWAHKAMSPKGRFVVRHVKDEVMEIFEMTGFSEIIAFE